MSDIVSLFDVSAFVFRGTTSPTYSRKYSEGMMVGGLGYLFTRVANALGRGHKVALFMDSRTNRKEILPEYKSGRGGGGHDAAIQISMVQDLCGLCGLPVYKEDGQEADDLVAAAAEYLSPRSLKVIVNSGDNDLTHCIDVNVEFKSTDESVNSLDLSTYKYGLYPGKELYPVTTSTYKVFTGCESDGIGTFTSEKGIKGEDLYSLFVATVKGLKPDTPISFLKSKKLLDLFLKIQFKAERLTLTDMEKLSKRMDVIFPRETQTKEFTPRGLGQMRVDRFSEILVICKEVVPSSVNMAKTIVPPESLKQFFKTKAKEHSTGSFAADNSFAFDSLKSSIKTEVTRDYFS